MENEISGEKNSTCGTKPARGISPGRHSRRTQLLRGEEEDLLTQVEKTPEPLPYPYIGVP